MNTRMLSAAARRVAKRQARKDRRLGVSPAALRADVASAVETTDRLRAMCQDNARRLQESAAALWLTPTLSRQLLPPDLVARIRDRLAREHSAMSMWLEWSNDPSFLSRWCARINRDRARRARAAALLRLRWERQPAAVKEREQASTRLYLDGLVTRDVQ